MSDVTLTSSVRQNLLSLQSTSDLISRTQNRLSTGLRVASAVDDPVAFFQAKGLQNRASDFEEKKTGIDQGISTLTTATNAVAGIESLVQQLKGLATNAKAATTATEITNIVTQFNDLRTQINNLTSDASYQGLNLVNGTGSSLSVNFSNDTASVLTVGSVDITSNNQGLAIAKVSAIDTGAKLSLSGPAVSAGTLTNTGTVTFTVAGTSTHTVAGADAFSLSLGTQSFTVTVYTAAANTGATAVGTGGISAGTYSVGDTIIFTLESGGLSVAKGLIIGATSVTVTEQAAVRAIGVGTTTELTARIANLDSALTTIRSRAQTLGANVAILNARLDFTKDYVNTLTAGAGKLTLADLNEEGANLLALQTRQQLGIQSLAFAGQSEQAILGLFR